MKKVKHLEVNSIKLNNLGKQNVSGGWLKNVFSYFTLKSNFEKSFLDCL